MFKVLLTLKKDKTKINHLKSSAIKNIKKYIVFHPNRYGGESASIGRKGVLIVFAFHLFQLEKPQPC